MKESDFATWIEAILDLGGWTWTHFEPAVRQSGRWATPMRGDRGFPDYVALRDGRLLFAEIKSETGRLSRDQERWRDELRLAGAEWHLWRPDDRPLILEELR